MTDLLYLFPTFPPSCLLYSNRRYPRCPKLVGTTTSLPGPVSSRTTYSPVWGAGTRSNWCRLCCHQIYQTKILGERLYLGENWEAIKVGHCRCPTRPTGVCGAPPTNTIALLYVASAGSRLEIELFPAEPSTSNGDDQQERHHPSQEAWAVA